MALELFVNNPHHILTATRVAFSGIVTKSVEGEDVGVVRPVKLCQSSRDEIIEEKMSNADGTFAFETNGDARTRFRIEMNGDADDENTRVFDHMIGADVA